MADLNSGKLIEHIEEAKDWLDKAKNEYKNANPVRGGLILNLAQAEVKHAWELSHREFVSKDNQVAKTIRKPRHFVPIAAVIVLVVALIVGVKISRQWVTPSHIAKTNTSPILENNFNPVIGKKEAELTNQSDLNPVVVKTPGPIVKTSEAPNNLLVKNDVSGLEPSSQSRINSVKTNNTQDVTQNKVVLKPVTQLTIDEDALTSEASHSLRNGK